MKLYDNIKNLSLLKIAVDSKMPVLLVGETGVGKTTIIRENSKACGKKLVRVNLNGQTGIEEIAGKWLIAEGKTYWQDGILTRAMKEGAHIVFDEINSANAEVLFFLNPLLDDERAVVLAEKDGERVEPHEDFRFFATMNPSDEYSGTKEMNKALLSRFGIILNVDPLPQTEETELLSEYIDQEQAKELAKIGAILREEKIKGELYYFCSTRDLIYLAKLLATGAEKNDAIHSAIILKANKDEQEKIGGLIKGIISGFTLTKTEKQLEDIRALEARLEKAREEIRNEQAKARNLEGRAKESAEMIGKQSLESKQKLEMILDKIYSALCESCKMKVEELFESKGALEGKGDGINLPFKPRSHKSEEGKGTGSAGTEGTGSADTEGEKATREKKPVDPKNTKGIKVGSKVKIAPRSKFWGQSFLTGEVKEIDADKWANVLFSDGTSNTYPLADLDKARKLRADTATAGTEKCATGESTATTAPSAVFVEGGKLSLSGKAISDAELAKLQEA